MKLFFRKHKIVLIALFGVLCIGVLSGLLLTGAIRLATAGSTFETVAEAQKEAVAPPTVLPDQDGKPTEGPVKSEMPTLAPMPEPTPKPAAKMSANDVKGLMESVQDRRRWIIPIRSELWISDNLLLWKQADAPAQEEERVQKAAEELTGILFGQTYRALTTTPVEAAQIRLYTDPSGDRDAFYRITDPNGMYLLSIRASDLSLICADLLTYPERISTDHREECIKIAEALGYSPRLFRNWMHEYYESVYQLKTESDVCLMFAFIGDRLWQAAVFPSEQAMDENEYFLADIQQDLSTPAYPERFTEAEPPAAGASEMITERLAKVKLTRLYQRMAGVDNPDPSELTATFLRDDSGAREDCWKIEGEWITAVISAYSRNIIEMECRIPCRELLSIPYEKMGGEEYVKAAREIGNALFTAFAAYHGDTHGKAVKEVSVNAVYDWHNCTMDVELEDGTFYELRFTDGVLTDIQFFANEDMFYYWHFGWPADSVYINKATGKPFIPDYRYWDGDLRLAHPEQ